MKKRALTFTSIGHVPVPVHTGDGGGGDARKNDCLHDYSGGKRCHF